MDLSFLAELNPMDEIIPNLWLGSYPSVKALQKNANNIQSIISVLNGRMNIPDDFVHHQILLDDTGDADIISYFLPSIAFIQAELDQSRRVLVHCHAGISRSTTIVAAYLMYTRNIDRDAALAFIRNIRPYVQPNDGFMTQLDKFYQASFIVQPQAKKARPFFLKKRAETTTTDNAGVSPERIVFLPHPPELPDMANSSKSIPRIRCRMCRQELATKEHIVHTEPSANIVSKNQFDVLSKPIMDGETPSALPSYDIVELTTLSHDKPDETHTVSREAGSPMLIDPKCSGYFLEQMDWMAPFLLQEGLVAGKVTCPNKKCGAKLGNYNWTGVRCGCKEWITPGICISRSKVDEITSRPG